MLGNSEKSALDEFLKQQLQTDLNDEIKKEVIKSLNKKYISEIIKHELSAGTFWFKPLQENHDKAMEIRKQNAKNEYYFITICPYEDVEITDLIKVMDKIIKKKWFKQYIYVYEQRQTEKDKPFYGIHSHIIVKRDTIAKSDVIREVYNTAKNICGSKQSIDVNLLKTRDELDVRINYLLGDKSTEEKQQRQQIDKILRDNNKLKSYYISGEWDDIIPMTLQKSL
jgi:hypothetical protein